MSRKKHNISYIKQDEPKFLRELKEQIGYKEGSNVDTKVKYLYGFCHRLNNKQLFLVVFRVCVAFIYNTL